MLVAATPLANFINKNPTVVMLALGFLLVIGVTLIAEGFGAHVPKGYIYAAMAFSVLVEGAQHALASRGSAPERERCHASLTAAAVAETIGHAAMAPFRP